ncbi:peptidase MA family metallohydrolase [Neobacillus drentensis]|uniref:peptidase MA family metallohydrolase n=1 Tax=Neobacillus drentensis TaxID=220684 RepID=UPI0008254923|nr:peptidase MA family metallohydrolase [Neobacillus drentensis]
MKLKVKKSLKIVFIVGCSITILVSFFIFIVLKELQKEMSQKVGTEVKLADMIKAVSTLNYNSDSEDEIKKKSDKKVMYNVTVYYNPGLKGILPQTKESLKRAEQLTKKYLGIYKNKPVDLLFMDSNELKKFSTLKDISGSYSDFDKVIAIGVNEKDMVSIIQEKETPLYFFQKSIFHEYTHFATYRKLDEIGVRTNDLPVWFVEGIAEYVGENEEPLDFHSFEPTFIELKQLDSHDQWEKARQTKRANPYLQSYFTVAYLINTYGENIIPKLLMETSTTKNFYGSLQEITGTDLNGFEEHVLSFYQK